MKCPKCKYKFSYFSFLKNIVLSESHCPNCDINLTYKPKVESKILINTAKAFVIISLLGAALYYDHHHHSIPISNYFLSYILLWLSYTYLLKINSELFEWEHAEIKRKIFILSALHNKIDSIPTIKNAVEHVVCPNCDHHFSTYLQRCELYFSYRKTCPNCKKRLRTKIKVKTVSPLIVLMVLGVCLTELYLPPSEESNVSTMFYYSMYALCSLSIAMGLVIVFSPYVLPTLTDVILREDGTKLAEDNESHLPILLILELLSLAAIIYVLS